MKVNPHTNVLHTCSPEEGSFSRVTYGCSTGGMISMTSIDMFCGVKGGSCAVAQERLHELDVQSCTCDSVRGSTRHADICMHVPSHVWWALHTHAHDVWRWQERQRECMSAILHDVQHGSRQQRPLDCFATTSNCWPLYTRYPAASCCTAAHVLSTHLKCNHQPLHACEWLRSLRRMSTCMVRHMAMHHADGRAKGSLASWAADNPLHGTEPCHRWALHALRK